MVEQREKVREKMRELILVAKETGKYTKEAVMNIICICCSAQMETAGFNETLAMDKAIELIKTKTKAQVYDELLKISGFED